MPASSLRLPALDGMRGIAACIVVLFHITEIARPVVQPEHSLFWYVLTGTPVKLLTAGTESVLVFFVLSGLVVALPALRHDFSWRSFYASRLLRLYLPVWASLLLVTALVLVIPRDTGAVTPDSWMTNTTVTSITLPALLGEASLLRGSYDINAVLWSLRWEVVFSLLLPLFVAVALLVRRWWWLAAALCAILTVSGRVLGNGALIFLPVFFLGTLMAVRLDAIRAWAVGSTKRLLWPTIIGGSALLLVVNWLARPFFGAGTPVNEALYGLAGLGAAGLIFAALGSTGFERMLSSAVPRWLGRVSFSLYLVHVPVLTTLTFALGDHRWWLVGICGIPLSLGAAWAFYRWVERPSHSLAKRVGRIAGLRAATADGQGGAM